VPVDKQTIEVSAGVTGLLVGTIVAGPVFGVILAAASNYFSKKDGEIGDIARAIGSSTLGTLNFLSRVSSKYSLGQKVGEATETVVDKLKESDTSDIVAKVETTLKSTTEKVVELDQEYDLKGKTGSLLVQAGDLTSTLIDKAQDYNKEYKLTDKIMEKLAELINKAKSS